MPKVIGAGHASAALNVFKVIFSQNTSNVPRLEAWEDYTFVAPDPGNESEAIEGTSGNGDLPMIGCAQTTDLVGPGADWHPNSATAGGAGTNLLKRDTNYCNLDSAAIDTGVRDYVTFNLSWRVPSDCSIPSNMGMVFVVKFTYAGDAPVLTWQYNAGTEGTPSWQGITPGSAGNTIKPADSGLSGPPIVIHRPLTGQAYAADIWVV